MCDKHLVLGIDIGTTSVKVVVVNTANNELLAKHSKDTQSNVPSDQGTDGNKQDVPKIVSALNTCVAKLPKELLRQVQKIGVCGQMHGVMLWYNKDGIQAWDRVEKDGSFVRYDIRQEKVSHLYTWQDSRCDSDFIASLPKPDSHLSIYSGYGVATLFWMEKYKPEKLAKYNCASTIHDFVVAMLCNLQKPVMSIQNAASWGYFNCQSATWNFNVLRSAGFPVDLLPTVIKPREIVGQLVEDWHTIPKGTPIGVALGDLQCSVLATIEQPFDAILNISTSAQLAFVANGYIPTSNAIVSPVEYFPYFDDRYLAVAASLNGGNVLATFVKMVQQWSMDLGFMVPQSKIWDKLLALSDDDSAISNMSIQPTLLGERYSPNVSASVANINIGNIGIGQVFRALCRGLIENLNKLMPKDVLVDAKISRIVGNGSGLSRNKILQKEVQQLYQLPLEFTASGDAAKGAAMALNVHNKVRDPEQS